MTGVVVWKLTWGRGMREQGKGRGTGMGREIVISFGSTEKPSPQEVVRRTTEGREVQAMVCSFIQNVFIETE